MDANSRVQRANQYLHLQPGEVPNYELVRQLRQVLKNDIGTIFRYAAQKNIVLNQISLHLLEILNVPFRIKRN